MFLVSSLVLFGGCVTQNWRMFNDMPTKGLRVMLIAICKPEMGMPDFIDKDRRREKIRLRVAVSLL